MNGSSSHAVYTLLQSSYYHCQSHITIEIILYGLFCIQNDKSQKARKHYLLFSIGYVVMKSPKHLHSVFMVSASKSIALLSTESNLYNEVFNSHPSVPYGIACTFQIRLLPWDSLDDHRQQQADSF